MTIDSTLTGHTGGAAVAILGDGSAYNQSFTIDDLYIADVYQSLLVDVPSGTSPQPSGTIFVSKLTIVNVYDHGVLIQHCAGSAYFSQVYIIGGGTARPNMIGFVITEGDTYYLTDFDIVGCNSLALGLQPVGTQQLSNVTLAQVYCDTIGGTGFYANGANASSGFTLTRVRLVNCWSANNAGYGFYFKTCNHIDMVETYCLTNENHGIYIDVNVDQFRMIGGQVLLNGHNSSYPTYDCIYITGGTPNFSINDVVCGGTLPDQP